MSLVAYTASDESDQSDTDEPPQVLEPQKTSGSGAQSSPEKIQKGTIQNDDKTTNAVTDNNAENDNISDSDSEPELSFEPKVVEKGVGGLLKGLPQPKECFPEHKIEDLAKEDDELEDEVKPKPSQLRDAPKPPPKKTKVKITIPELQYDSDEDKQVKKKPKLAEGSGKSGLASLLPAPMHTSGKETNRLLLPYSLTKKQTDKTVKKPSQQSVSSSASKNTNPESKENNLHVKSIIGITGYGSDSDDSDTENSGNYFSLGEPVNNNPVLPEVPSDSKLTKLSLPPPKLSDKTSEKTDGQNKETPVESGDSNDRLSIPDGSDSSLPVLPNQDAPLEFKMSNQDVPLTFKEGNWNAVTRTYSKHLYSGDNYSVSDAPEDSHSTMYPQPEGVSMDYQQNEYDQALPEQNEVQGLVQDEEFLKMQGKKQRGKEEINIVDINADDFINTAELQKTLTQEVEQPSSHKKKDGPTSQQKRKHQITYLAFQAKERELELKNQWSQNRMTKRQTQAKYGF